MQEDKNKTNFSDIGKEIAIERLFEGSGYSNSGDFTLKNGQTLHKIMLEGVDFDLIYTPLKHLGYKAALSIIGDAYANMTTPKHLSIVLGISAKFYFEDISDLWCGFLACAKEFEIEDVTLDLVPSINGLCISMSLMSQIYPIKKSTPKSMDLICLSGNLGAAYMGLHVLEREKVAFSSKDAVQPNLEKYKYLLQQYLSPSIKKDTLKRVKEYKLEPSSAYFMTQSLASTIKKIEKKSKLGVKLYIDRLPIASETFQMSEELNIDAITAAINGGEDYRFLFVVPIEKHSIVHKEFPDFDVIGHLAQPETGRVLVTPEGAELNIP